MSAAFTYSPAADAELDALADLATHAFAIPTREAARTWLEKSHGTGNTRVLRDGGEPVACAVIVPMGQFFGGRSVRMAGIAGVAVAPHQRAKGCGSRLMRAVVEELHAAGWPISTLYPATRPVYRRVGYESAGGLYEFQCNTWLIDPDVREKGGALRPIAPADFEPQLAPLYRRCAQASAGCLDRGPYIWSRIREPREGPAAGFVVEFVGQAEGYIIFVRRRERPGPHDLYVVDVAAATPRAGRRLLSFLAEQRSTGPSVTWFGGPFDPLAMLMREPHYKLRLRDHWMLRITHAPAALAARGYAPCVSAELHLELRDDVLPAQQQRLVLRVRDGAGAVEPGGRGRVVVDVRGLAMLYSGFASAEQVRACGHIDGPADELSLASAVFAGPAPYMVDMF